MTAKHAILVVEDEAAIRTGLCDVLAFHGHAPAGVESGEEGLRRALAAPHALVVLDVMLPGMSGFDVCRALRAQRPEQAILLLTARGAEADVLEGFRCGADDYVTKPFSIRELLARVRAVLRRTEGRKQRLARYRFADVELDFEHYKASKAGQALDMSPREFELLRYLIERKGDTVTRDQLLEDVWGYESYPSTRTVDTHIAKLRAKIGDSGSEPRYILTIHGMGYKFIDPA